MEDVMLLLSRYRIRLSNLTNREVACLVGMRSLGWAGEPGFPAEDPDP